MAFTQCTGNSTAMGTSHLQAHWEELASKQGASPAVNNRNVWRSIPQEKPQLKGKGMKTVKKIEESCTSTTI